MTETKKTPLHSYHLESGANMAEFGGYEMPLWYPAGTRQEHLAVLTAAGMFDTSHMAVLTLEGPDARPLLQYAFTKDLDSCIGKGREPLPNGRCVYGLFLDAAAHVIDDTIVYQVRDELFMVVVNASMGGPVKGHLENIAQKEGFGNLRVTDFSDRLVKIDVQGVQTLNILNRVLADVPELFTPFPYFSFKGWFDETSRPTEVKTRSGIPLMLSRTGYTGEFGFELFVQARHGRLLWDELLQAGAPYGLLPCGLAARDSLRAGAMLPLSHQDIGSWTFAETPWPFVLPLDEQGDFSKTFLGRKKLEAGPKTYTYGFAGYDPRKIPVTDETVVTDLTGDTIGKVLTCTTDISIGRKDDTIFSIVQLAENDKPPRGLSCGFILLNREVNYGDRVVLSAGKRKIEVEIVSDIRPGRTARVAMKSMIEKL